MRLFPLLLIGAVACVPKSVTLRLETLEAQVASLETQVSELSKRPAHPARPGTAPAAFDQSAEQAAAGKLQDIQRLVNDLDFSAAKEACRKVRADYGHTEVVRRRARVCDEAEVVGKKAASWGGVGSWFQGGPPSGNEATLIVFFEQWCPHCKREVPRLQSTHERYQGRMSVVGVTKVNRSATDDKVRDFIGEKGLTFAVGKEADGELSRHYAVTGVPAAAFVRDGEVVWRGHPARLNDELLERLLSGR